MDQFAEDQTIAITQLRDFVDVSYINSRDRFRQCAQRDDIQRTWHWIRMTRLNLSLRDLESVSGGTRDDAAQTVVRGKARMEGKEIGWLHIIIK